MISVRSNWPGVLLVDAEVRLQRHVDVLTGRHVDEAAATPHRRVERGELVVAGRDDRAEVLLDEIGVVAERVIHAREEDAALLEVLPVAVVDDFRFVLRRHAGEELALGFGDAELLVGGLHRLGQLGPLGDLTLGGLEVVVDVVEVHVGHVLREPVEHRLALEPLQRVEPELRHPLGLVLVRRRCRGRRFRSGPSWARRRSRRSSRASRACTCRGRCPGRPSGAPAVAVTALRAAGVPPGQLTLRR